MPTSTFTVTTETKVNHDFEVGDIITNKHIPSRNQFLVTAVKYEEGGIWYDLSRQSQDDGWTPLSDYSASSLSDYEVASSDPDCTTVITLKTFGGSGLPNLSATASASQAAKDQLDNCGVNRRVEVEVHMLNRHGDEETQTFEVER